MSFTVQPLRFTDGRPAIAVPRQLQTVDLKRYVDPYEFFREIQAGRNFILGGPRGCGKTSLLNEIAYEFSLPPSTSTLIVGPIALRGVESSRFEFFRAALHTWLRESYRPFSVDLAEQAEFAESLHDWSRIIARAAKNIGARLIVLLLDDVDSVPRPQLEPILSDLQLFLVDTGHYASLGCAGNLLADEMVLPGLMDPYGYLLGGFTRSETDNFFKRISRIYPYRNSISSAPDDVLYWTGSIPYFLHALMLSVAVFGSRYGERYLNPAFLGTAVSEMPDALIRNFARPLGSLTHLARYEAQAMINRMLRNDSVPVEWEHSVVRDLVRWGLVRRDARNFMMWSSPLLRRWFERIGAGFVNLENFRWETEELAAIETTANQFAEVVSVVPPPRKPEPSQPDLTFVTLTNQTAQNLINSIMLDLASGHDEVRISKDTATELYASLLTNLGTAADKKGDWFGVKGKGKGDYELERVYGDEGEHWRQHYDYDDVRYLLDFESRKPPTRSSVLTRRPSIAGGLARYINLWFTHDLSDAAKIDKTRALVHNQEVYLRMNIGPLDSRTLMNVRKAVAFVSEQTMAKAFPETAGKPVPLEATIFSRDFIIPEGSRTQKFTLLPGTPSVPVFFPLIPHHKGQSQLRLCVFYKNHLLQSLNVVVTVNKRGGKGRIPQTAVVELTFSAEFTNVAALPGRALWLGVNQGADDTHSINLKSSDKALSRDLQNKIEKALTKARQALLDVSFNLKMENGKEKKVYRFNSENFPNVDFRRYIDRLREDLARLAAAGSGLYEAIFGFVPTVEQKETVWPIVKELQEKLRYEETIQIARLKRMEDIWPWAMVYDAPIHPPGVKRVCLAYRGKDGPVPYAKGDQCDHARDDETVVCPYNFWGFKHIIEQPTQPGGKAAFNAQNLGLEIKIGNSPVYRMPLHTGLGKEEETHVTNMENLNFTKLSSLAEIAAALNPKSNPPPAEPHIMYFFCHGKAEGKDEPYLSVGADEVLLTSKLNRWDFRWPNSRGLVFINGCHTVDLDPSQLSTIMQPFIEAGASGIIGTEISVTTGLAREFANEFFKRFLNSDPNVGQAERQVGKIIKDVRLKLLMNYNPLGLVYTPYCSADLHVA